MLWMPTIFILVVYYMMRAIKEELGDGNDNEGDVAALERKMQSAGMPSNIWKHAYRELRYDCRRRRFAEVSGGWKLLLVCWLEIRVKINMRMLPPATMYNAYLVSKLTSDVYGFKNSPVVVTVGLVGGESTKQSVTGPRLREKVDSDRFAQRNG